MTTSAAPGGLAPRPGAAPKRRIVAAQTAGTPATAIELLPLALIVLAVGARFAAEIAVRPDDVFSLGQMEFR